MTVDRAKIVALLRAKVETHAELRRAISLDGLRRVLARERVDWVVRPHPRPAQLVPFLGRWMIIVDDATSNAERLAYGAHELGHLWLHHDSHFERWETLVYNVSEPWASDLEEEEADVFAELLVRGPAPSVTLPLADVRKSANKRVTAQLPLDFNEPQGLDRVARRLPPIAKLERKPFVEKPLATSREYERGVARRGSAKVSAKSSTWLAARPVSDQRTDDDERIKWRDEAKGTTRFTDTEGGRWWLYNYRVVDGRRVRIRDFMSSEITHRLFVNAAGVRRLYRFTDAAEHRAYRCKHLDRQLAEAKQLAADDESHRRAPERAK